MKPALAVSAAAAATVLAVSGCGAGTQTTQHAAPSPAPSAPTPTKTPTPAAARRPAHTTPVAHDTDTPSVPFSCQKPAPPSPHFVTPEGAMRYLASAWNRRDYVRLCHVTTADARGQLNGMHTEAR